MKNRIASRRTAARVAAGVSSVLLSAAVIAAAAHAQTLPTTPLGTPQANVGSDGAQAGIEGGPAGGVNVTAGPGGVGVGLGSSPLPQVPPVPGLTGPTVTPSTPASGATPTSAPTTRAPAGPTRPAAEPQRGGSAGDAREGTSAASRARDARGAGESRAEGTRTRTRDDLRPTAETKAERNAGGLAPFFDIVENVPDAVWAGFAILTLIAIALWASWIRGRRRLEQNAYVDPDTGVANMAAFDQLIEREWARAVRYRRPLGLVLLDFEHNGGAMRLLGESEARGAVERIQREVRASDSVARLAPGRFAVICPEAPAGSVETLAHALEHRLEEQRLHCWAGFAERHERDERPADLVTRAAAVLADVRARGPRQSDEPAGAKVVPLDRERAVA